MELEKFHLARISELIRCSDAAAVLFSPQALCKLKVESAKG